MNKNLKRLTYGALAVAVVLATVFGCQTDDGHQEEYHQESRIKYVSLNEFIQDVNPDVNYKALNGHFDINKETLPNNLLGRSVSSDLVLTNTIVAMDNGFGTSYTFMLQRQTEGDEFYNLIVNLDNNGTISDTRIYEYIPSQNNVNDTDQPFSGQLFIHQNDLFSDNDILNVASRGQQECFEVIEYWECGAHNEHPPGTSTDICPTQGPYTLALNTVQVPCGGAGTSGGIIINPPDNSNPPNTGQPSNGGGTNTGNPSGGTGTNTSIPTLTTPIDKEKGSTANETEDCKTLKNLRKTDSLHIDILPYVNQLRNRINLDKEWSVSFKKEWNDGNMKTSPSDDGVKEGIDKHNSYYTAGGNFFGQVHSHPKGTRPMFSWKDLKALEDIYSSCREKFQHDVFLMMVGKVGTDNVTYALKVNDINALGLALQNDLDEAKGNTNDEKEKSIEKFLKNEYNKSTDLEKTFLELYGNHGFSFYKAADDNLSNWNKLELDESNNDEVKENPCN